jgi:translation initiation factor IF-3
VKAFLLSLFFLKKGEIIIFKELLINEQIKAKEVRLLDENGEQVGIVSFDEALDSASEKDLDLVLLNPNSNPPVCKLMDYGKYKFDSIKREKELKKNQNIPDIKAIWLSMTIDKHDLETKAKHGNKFLKDGDKLKVILRMKGRQRAFSQIGLKVMQDFFSLVEANGIMDKQPVIMGKNITMIITPKK